MKTLTYSENVTNPSCANDSIFLQRMQLKKAAGSRVYCDHGQAYIDLSFCATNNILGHNIQAVQQAIRDSYGAQPQCSAHLLETSSHRDLQNNLANILPNQHFPYFMSSHESVAMDMALKLAYTYWNTHGEKQRVSHLALAHSYHGSSFGTLGLNATLPGFDVFRPAAATCEHIPFPHTWLEDAQVEQKEKIAYDRLASYLSENASTVSALIIEPMLQSLGGMHLCRPAFLSQVVELVHSYGILIIADERFTALLRCGSLFASNLLAIEPDIIVLGSSLTNGCFPFGVTSLSKRLSDSLDVQLNDPHFLELHGYNAHNASIYAASATLKQINTATMSDHVRQLHFVHEKRLRALTQRLIVEKARFIGTVAAFDFVCEKHNLKFQLTSWFQDACAKERILVQCRGQTVYLIPPLCLSVKDLEHIYDSIEKIIASVPLAYITACS